MKLKLTDKAGKNEDLLLLGKEGSTYGTYLKDKAQLDYLKTCIKDDRNEVVINQYNRHILVCHVTYGRTDNPLEKIRLSGQKLQVIANSRKLKSLTIIDLSSQKEYVKALIEGIYLGNYQFLKYKNAPEDKANSLTTLQVLKNGFPGARLAELQHILEGVTLARDLVNEPLSFLNAVQLSKEIENTGAVAGFKTEVFGKKKIESLRMGGLLAVNRGSIDPPTFTILTWNPPNAKNRKPVVLVGKGIVFDTGGLSLKPTYDSMDYMKSDMAGAAAVTGLMYAAARNRLPVYIIGLIPATDNRPDGNAYVPGDVVRMYDGTTVEVLNTDAEGRMILADALSWAKKYKPQLVINLATLTGSAQMTLGKYGIAAMGNVERNIFASLAECGEKVYERIAELPFWDEYNELLKSDIADIRNVGGKYAGAIIGGKFLEKFTDYPFIHLDIAGPSFNRSEDAYRGKGGSGICVRLLYEFLKSGNLHK
jgi:leucyl aminopeptidase